MKMFDCNIRFLVDLLLDVIVGDVFILLTVCVPLCLLLLFAVSVQLQHRAKHCSVTCHRASSQLTESQRLREYRRTKGIIQNNHELSNYTTILNCVI